MQRVRIVTDSTADLPRPLTQELGITVVPLNVHFGRETYRDGIDISTDDFYHRLATSLVHPTTSAPSAGAFLEAYESVGAEAEHIFSIHISSKLSGTVNSALVARNSYSGPATIEIVDSRVASLGLGLIVLKAAEVAQGGGSAQDVQCAVEKAVANVRLRFFVETLTYLQRGGRIGRAQALLGGLLNVKPILKVEDGEVHPVEKVRSRSKAIDRLVEFVESTPRIERLAIVHINTPDDAEHMATRLSNVISRDRVLIGRIGPVVGTHIGPGGMGVMTLEDK